MLRRQVARDLGIDIHTLRRWLSVHEASGSTPPAAGAAEYASAAELTRLRRENEQFRIERDFSKQYQTL